MSDVDRDSDWFLNRRSFLKGSVATAAALALLRAKVVIAGEEEPDPEAERPKVKWVEEQNRLLAPKRSEVSAVVMTTPLNMPLDMGSIPEIVTARYYLKSTEEKMRAIVKALGPQTLTAIDYSALAYEPKELQDIADYWHKKVIDYQVRVLDPLRVRIADPETSQNTKSELSRRLSSLSNGEYMTIVDSWNLAVGVPRYTPRRAVTADNPGGVYPCDTFSMDITDALLGLNVSRVDDKDRPVRYGGRELGARDIHDWMKTHAKEYGGYDVTKLSYDNKVELLRRGMIMYGSTIGHTFILWGMRYPPTGETLPVVSQTGDWSANVRLASRFDWGTKVRIMPLESEYDPTWHAFMPPEFKLPDKYPTEDYQRQRFIGECGPACVAMVMSILLKYSPEQRIALMDSLNRIWRITGEDGKPTGRYATASELKSAIDAYDMPLSTRFLDLELPPYEILKVGESRSGGRPMIARINDQYNASEGGFNHFVVVVSVDKKTREVIVFDPLNLFPDHLVKGMKPYLNGPVRVSMEMINRAMVDKDGKRGEILIFEE